jgi:hypothetical protein
MEGGTCGTQGREGTCMQNFGRACREGNNNNNHHHHINIKVDLNGKGRINVD